MFVVMLVPGRQFAWLTIAGGRRISWGLFRHGFIAFVAGFLREFVVVSGLCRSVAGAMNRLIRVEVFAEISL